MAATGSDKSTKHNPRAVTEFDAELGERIRIARKLAGYSQTELAEKLGLTFQQVQKYEQGKNRIAAGRLVDLADALGKPLGFFYDNPAAFEPGEPIFQPLKGLDPDTAQRVLTALERADPKVRRSIVNMIETVTSDESDR
ncbi:MULTISPECIES: helix-turn-helix domain-containing protein [Hyphobacterium]|uniref:Helix-turn-helix domain-containing protein n=1 Tax=Hyphobacterium vulgare TaxID=1736751 RepID=A0ABV6ZWX2_9PROT